MSRVRTRIETGAAETGPGPEARPLLPISAHGRWRRSRRGFCDRQLDYVIRYGAVFQRAGATFYVLRRRDLPDAHRRDDACAKLIGTVVVVERGVVSTVYRNARPVRHVQKKPKYDARRRDRIASLPLEAPLLRPTAAA